jgi:two-component system sensor histidine kinase/response regulator
MEDRLKLRDSLQIKVGTIFILLAIAFGVGSYVALRWLVFPAFTQLEQETAVDDLGRVKQIFDSELESLGLLGHEYSDWSQSYAFVKGKAPNFVRKNVAPEAWEDIDVDAMLFFNVAGDLIWGTILDPVSGEARRIEFFKSPLLPMAKVRISETQVKRDSSGLIYIPGGLMLIVAQSIVKTDGSGTPAGFFVIGRYVTEKRLAEFERRARVDFSLLPMTTALSTGQSGPINESHALPHSPPGQTYSDSEIITTEIWKDLFGLDVVYLDVHTPRNITAIGSTILRVSVIFIGGLGVLFVLFSWMAVRRMVINPLTRLKAHMITVGETGDLTLSLDLKGQGEIGALAHQFDLLTTELQVAHLELLEARDQALSSTRMKSEFLASMSHEIRTPMNGVIGMTEMLLKSDLSAGQLRLVDTVSVSAKSLLAIINDILDFSKIEAGKMQIDDNVFPLERLVRDVNAVVAQPAQVKGLEYLCRLAPDLPPGIVADDHRLGQVLINLLGNAVKFTDIGEVILSVDCTKTWWKGGEEWGALNLTVSDTGVGISPALREKVFQSFSQADSSTTRNYGGTGLGLTICKQLVELMGGRIAFRSKERVGTEFSITLPVRLDRSLAAKPESMQITEGRSKKLNILIIDDNKSSLELLAEQLAFENSRADTFTHCASALTAMRRAADQGWHYDLLLVDYPMVEPEGLSFPEQVASNRWFGNPAVVLLSSLSEDFTGQNLTESGVHSYLSKPVLRADLFAHISHVFQHRLPLSEGESVTKSLEEDVLLAEKLNADILVVEDNAVNQQLASILLQDYGCNALLAGNGELGVAALNTRSFDLVLMDCQMPVMDGFEATRIIREKNILAKNGGRLPVVALTANAMDGDKERCLAAGMDAYIAKPFNHEELFTVLRLLLPVSEEPISLNRHALDQIRAVQSAGQPSVLNLIIDAYLETAPGLVEALEKGIGSNDARAVEINAHMLKSSSASLGAVQFATLCAEIEKKGRAEFLDDAGTLTHRLKTEFTAVCIALGMERTVENFYGEP